MQRQGTKSSVIRVRETVDNCMQRISPDDIIVAFYVIVLVWQCHKQWPVRTGSFNKPSIMLGSQEWIREIAEELLQQTSNTIHVVNEICGIPEIYPRCIYTLLAITREL